MTRFVAGCLVVAFLFSSLAGCAKFPSSGGGANSTRLIFTMTMAAPPNPNFVYIFAFRPSTDLNPQDSGPIPVIAPPWGNGFVAGHCTHFVRWDVTQSPDYLLYMFQDPDLLNYSATGVPISYHLMEPTDRTFRFEIDLSQIVPAGTESQYQSIQVNFLTMDSVPQGGGGTKVWDALGDSGTANGINQYVTIPLKTSGLYDNARFQNLEPPNDVQNGSDPSLDIVDWSIEVRPA